MIVKEDKTIAEQVASMLRSGIRRGDFPPEKPLPGERKLSQLYGVCRATVVAALDKLAEEKLICKIPARGNFVLQHELPPKILLLYPEKTLGETLHPENAAAFLDFYRGLLDSAASYKTEISTLCVTEKDFENDPEEYIKKVSDFDVLIFSSRQLPALRQIFRGKKVMIVRDSMLPEQERESDISIVTPDYGTAFRDLTKKVAGSGFKSLCTLTLSCDEWSVKKCRLLEQSAQENGLGFENIMILPEQLPAVIPQLAGRFIFFTNTFYFGKFYHACMTANLFPGKDFQLTGLCSGSTLINLIPEPSFIKIPNYELGQEAFRLARKKISDRFVQIPTFLIENDTTGKGTGC